MRIPSKQGRTLPALLLGLAYSFSALAGTELINNGNFGTTTYPSTFNPSSSGWTSTSSALTLKTQTVPYGCGQYACYGGTADIWACTTSTSSAALFSQENGIATLKPSTRYRISFNGFRNITGLGAGDSTRAQNANLVVRVKSGVADYAVKDILLSPITFGSFTPGINGTTAFEFVTPVDMSPAGQPNLNQTKVAFSFDGSKGYNTGGICLSHVSLQEVDNTQSDNRVVVNTYGYPLQGKKVATWVLPPSITNLSGYKWQVRYKNSFPTFSYGVGISFYAVQTDSTGAPVKDGNGNYILQLDGNNKPKVVGGTGTGGQNSWLTPNSGLLNSAIINVDKDSGDRTVTLDFSDMGIQKTTAMGLPDLSGTNTPGDYTDSNNVKWKILSASSYNGGGGISSDGYSIRVLDSTGAIVAMSKQFSVLNAPFTSLKKDALFSLYHQRSGENINPQYGVGDKKENEAQSHDAGHPNETAVCFTGVDLHANNWEKGGSGCVSIASNPRDVSGGWYDAADHGKYVVNGGVALWTLQNMIERLQKKGTLNTEFPAGALSLPATLGSNGATLANLSDLMAEARKEMDWMLKMQIPSGYTMKVPVGNQANKQQPYDNGSATIFGSNSPNAGVYQIKVLPVLPVVTPVYRTIFHRKFQIGTQVTMRNIESPVASDENGDIHFAGGTLPRLRIKLDLTAEDVSGMVFHSVNDASWTGIPLAPNADTKQRLLMYPTSAATLNFAAVAAQCSRIWRGVDNAFADQCLAAAKTAWGAAVRLAGKGNVYRYEYTNTSPTADTSASGSWMTADSSGKNRDILMYGFALNPMFDGGGAYGDLRVGDEFLWASKELSLADSSGNYSTTGLLGDCSTSSLQCYSWIYGFDWQNVSPLGYLSSWTVNPTPTNPDAAKIMAAGVIFANYATPNSTVAQGYLFSKIRYSETDRNSHYDWGANGGVLNRSLILLAAHEANLSNIPTSNLGYCRSYANTGGLSGGYINPNWIPAPDSATLNKCLSGYKALDAAVNSMGYLLGRNTLEKSFISGYGNDALSSAHHRWFAKPADVAYPRIPAGFIAGGPNTRDLPALRANASRYSFDDMSKWLADHPGAKETDNTAWQVGDISDAGQQYLETQIVTKCTTGLENANAHWAIPAANQSGAVSYTPQKCYGDDYRSFATNEIAINWQAPLVWVTQYLSEIYQ